MPVILGGNTGIYLASLAPPAPSLLLDDYPNATVAYSLRKLRTAYTGAAIRVRRSSDNAEQDINFVSGDLDTQSLLDFVGYNQLTYSEDFTQPTPIWNKFQTSITANVEIAPDGSLTGDKLVESAVSGFHYVDRTNFPITNGLDYNISIYLKQAERTKILFTSAISGTNTSFAVDLTNGNISDNGFANTPIVTSEANGWYRVSLTITSGTTSAAPLIRIFTYNSSNQTNYTGNGTSGVYIWGAQLTQSSSVLPYTKTVADVSRNGFITTWYDQSTNANNSTQATAASQAQIVSAGTVITDPNTSKISTTWTADSYALINGVNPNTRYLSVSVNTRLTINDQILHLGNTTNPGTVNGQQSLRWRGTDGLIQSFRHTQSSHGLITTNGSYIIMSEKDSNNLKSVYINGFVNSSGTEVPADGTLMNQFGRSSTQSTTAQYQEFIYWDSEQSANRTAIEDNINTYWNAY
jgi:hypothetical protein